jgi:hypothetical protein
MKTAVATSVVQKTEIAMVDGSRKGQKEGPMKTTLLAVAILTLAGCGGGSSPTEPKTLPTPAAVPAFF